MAGCVEADAYWRLRPESSTGWCWKSCLVIWAWQGIALDRFLYAWFLSIFFFFGVTVMFWLEFWKERMQSKVVVELVAEEKKKKNQPIYQVWFTEKKCVMRVTLWRLCTHTLCYFSLFTQTNSTLHTLIQSPSYNRIRAGQFFTFFFPPPKIFLLFSSPSCYQPPRSPQHTRKQCLTHSPRHCRSRYVHWARPRPLEAWPNWNRFQLSPPSPPKLLC